MVKLENAYSYDGIESLGYEVGLKCCYMKSGTTKKRGKNRKPLIKSLTLRKLYSTAKAIYIKSFRFRKELLCWKKKGRPLPPPHLYKQRTVKEYAKVFSIMTFIETGTYEGAMVEATKTIFNKIYSIELDMTLYKNAKQRFSRFKNITIIQGDSRKVLPKLLKSIESPCLFWLDAHYSGGITAKGELETPIIQELQCILNHPIKKHVILIDDARYFVGQNDYPTTEELKKFVLTINPNLVFEIENDIIRIH